MFAYKKVELLMGQTLLPFLLKRLSTAEGHNSDLRKQYCCLNICSLCWALLRLCEYLYKTCNSICADSFPFNGILYYKNVYTSKTIVCKSDSELTCTRTLNYLGKLVSANNQEMTESRSSFIWSIWYKLLR